MKRLLLFVAMVIFTIMALYGQAPQKFNYQAIIKDNSDKVLVEKQVSFRFSILYKTSAGAVKYSETQTATTDKNGIVNLKIGEGTPVSGTMASIDWSDGPYFLKIELKYTTADYLLMGTAEISSVPFAMFANAISSVPQLKIVSPLTSNPDSSIFEVKNKDGQVIFAVYNQGVRVYVDKGVKGNKGGFAIGGFGTTKAVSQPYFIVGHDSIRAYVDTTSVKGSKGGFAIGGFSGAKGGAGNYMQLTPKNYFIGHRSGENNTTGLYNSFLGYLSGFSNTTGSSNTFFGDSTGYSNTDGSYNVFMGKNSGKTNTISISNVYIGMGAGKYARDSATSEASYNVAMGTLAGYYNKGNYNVFLGQESGFSNRSGKQNIFIGCQAGEYSDTAGFNIAIGSAAGFNNMGNGNVFMGNFAGYDHQAGSYNVFIGNTAGMNSTSGVGNVFLGSGAGTNTSGDYNTFLGDLSGYSNVSGSNNVFIGKYAGYFETGSDKLYIENSSNSGTSALIYGDFSTDQLRLNASVGINSAPSLTYTLFVNGSAGSPYGFFISSDRRIKQNIHNLENDGVIEKIKDVDVIKYNLSKDFTNDETLSKKKYIGVVAQDIEKDFPEAVLTDDKGYKAVNLYALTSILFQAMKDQQKEIELLKKEVELLKTR